MNTEIRHFLLTQDGQIREFTSEEAALIAAGANRLPEFAERRMRYLQVSWDPGGANELKVQTAGAAIKFDTEGRLLEAAPPAEDEKIFAFRTRYLRAVGTARRRHPATHRALRVLGS